MKKMQQDNRGNQIRKEDKKEAQGMNNFLINDTYYIQTSKITT